MTKAHVVGHQDGVAAADELTNVPLDEEFRFGLQLVLDGIERARSADNPSTSRARNMKNAAGAWTATPKPR